MGICFFHLTKYVQHGQFYVNNKTFNSLIFKISVNLPLIKFKAGILSRAS